MHVDQPPREARSNGWHVTHSSESGPKQWSFYYGGVLFGNVTKTIIYPNGGFGRKVVWRYEYGNGTKDTVAIGHADSVEEAKEIVRSETLFVRVLFSDALGEFKT